MFIQGNAQNTQVRQVCLLENWGRVIITVIGAGTVLVATTKEALETTGGGGQLQGSQYTQANTNPPKDVPWIGEMWAICPAGTSVDFQIPTKGGIPLNYKRGTQ